MHAVLKRSVNISLTPDLVKSSKDSNDRLKSRVKQTCRKFTILLFYSCIKRISLVSRSGAVRFAWAVAWLPGGGLLSSGHYEGEK